MKSFALILICLAAGCSPHSSYKTLLPTTQMTIGGKTFILEEAATESERDIGLRGRDDLPDDRGLIYIYQSPYPRSAVGTNVRLPLDVIFLDHDGHILAIHHEPAYGNTPFVDSQYILELAAGSADSLTLKVGDALKLPADCTLAPLPTTSITIAGQMFSLEKATTPAQQELGLMCRAYLAPEHGMIFTFPNESPRRFWNHDVHFPLDMIFMDHDARIIGIVRMAAFDDNNTDSFNTQYVIEFNAGTADNLHLKVGDRLNLPPDALAAR